MGYFSKVKNKASKGWGKSYASSYWYDDYSKSFDYYDKYSEYMYPTVGTAGIIRESHNLYKLASVRRAISNFVQIVAGRKIPVEFATKSDSMTDGKRVILSADVNDNFDVSVGLALHEASHILLSNFSVLRVMNDMHNSYQRMTFRDGMDTKSHDDVLSVIKSVLSNHAIAKEEYSQFEKICQYMFLPDGKIRKHSEMIVSIFQLIMNISNWIEDRRIDNYIYKNAPGYKNYYVSLYDFYFNDKVVTKGIASDEFRDETVDSYYFRVINLLNEKTDLDALKSLRKIYNLIDLKRISRLQSSFDSLELSVNIVEMILESCNDKSFTMSSPQTGNGTGIAGDGEDGDGDGVDIVVESDDDTNDGGAVAAAPSGAKMSDKTKTQILNKIKKQTDFLSGKVKKKNLSAADAKKIEAIEESGTEIKRVGENVNYRGTGGRISRGVDCVIVKKVTDSIMNESDFPCRGSADRYRSAVERGISMGILLGKKLQIRAESRDTIFNRLKTGKIDKRLIASLGFENPSVFYTNTIDNYKKVNLHISIDYSGSMCGTKLGKAVTTTIAIAKACSMARNIDVQISIRATTSRSPSLPWIAIIYDSKKDTIKRLCNVMAGLDAHSSTPEGLCFEAIQKYLIPMSNDMDSYFLNFSDGQPSYSIQDKTDSVSYSGDDAAEHTFKQIKNMKECGIKVLSYFITDYASANFERTSDWQIFKKSYGNDAKYVNVENILDVAKTMNQLFLEK